MICVKNLETIIILKLKNICSLDVNGWTQTQFSDAGNNIFGFVKLVKEKDAYWVSVIYTYWSLKYRVVFV